MHGWQFDLATGRCLTSDAPGHELRSRPAAADQETAGHATGTTVKL
jgi:nitrite reductase/ring-hydroxylating ferredoxin subunit